MNRLTSDTSSLDGDDSTVSSKSNRHRSLDEVNGDSNAETAQQVAEFSDMPSLASHRADEVSLASTLWTDCDQSLPSLSSYRTKDMSVASGSTRSKNSTHHDDVKSKSKVDDDRSDRSGTERTRGNLNTSGIQTPSDSIQENSAKAYSSSSRDEESSSNTANLSRGGDCMPRLPRRRPLDDSARSSSLQTAQSDSESASESDMTDDSPDVSIDTDEENDEMVEPAHGPSHIVSNIPPIRRLSPQSPKSPVRVNGVLPDIATSPLRVDDGNTRAATEKEKTTTSDDGLSPGEPPAVISTPPSGNLPKGKEKTTTIDDGLSPGEPPAVISTPPAGNLPKGANKSPKKQDGEAAPSQPELQQSPEVVKEKGNRWRKMKNKEDGKSKKTAPDRTNSGSDTRFFGKKNQSGKSRDLKRAKSEMVSVPYSIKPKDEKKRGILKRFSSSLKQMSRPSRTVSSTFEHAKKALGGKKRSKSKRTAKTSADNYKTGSA